jgi:hypothetical protein
MLDYNITRVKNILPLPKLFDLLKTWKPNYKGILVRFQNRLNIEPIALGYFFDDEKVSEKLAA